jgi:hypothetical protein
MPHDLYLIAHVVNAHSDQSEVELEVASLSANDAWYTNDGRQVWPFWWQPIETVPAIPEGWVEHIQEMADHFVAKRPTFNIAVLLPKAQVPTIRRRI